MKSHYEIVPLYCCGFIVAVGNKPSAIAKMIKNHTGVKIPLRKLTIHAGKCLQFECKGGGFIAAIILSDTSTQVIAHECVHAANGILEAVGVLHSPKNDEAFAYLVGYLANVCQEFIDQK